MKTASNNSCHIVAPKSSHSAVWGQAVIKKSLTYLIMQETEHNIGYHALIIQMF